MKNQFKNYIIFIKNQLQLFPRTSIDFKNHLIKAKMYVNKI